MKSLSLRNFESCCFEFAGVMKKYAANCTTPREESELKASATHIKNFDGFCISIQLVGTRIMLGGTRIALVLGTSNRRHCEICYEREALTYKFTSLK